MGTFFQGPLMLFPVSAIGPDLIGQLFGDMDGVRLLIQTVREIVCAVRFSFDAFAIWFAAFELSGAK